MHRDVLALGLPAPVIEQLPDPAVRTTLIGGRPETSWLALRDSLDPPAAGDDLDFLLVLDLAARQRGRISSTEAASLLDTSANTARKLLDELEADGALRPGREQRVGRGFFYLPGEQS